MSKKNNLEDDTQPYSVQDIYDVLTNTNIDVKNIVIHIDALEKANYNLQLLLNDNFSIIIYIPNPIDHVGHFCLLTEFEDYLEWFDPLAQSIPKEISELAKQNNLKLRYLLEPVQDEKSSVCAKWCVSRLFSLPLELDDYIDIFKSNKKYTPDQIVNNLFKLKKK